MSKLLTPFGFESTASDVLHGVDLSGKTALVTGASSGIGHETARALARAGAAVVMAARRDRAGSDAAAQIAISTSNPHVSHILLDLADLESVVRAAAGWSRPLHILVNNAGIMAVPELTRTRCWHSAPGAILFPQYIGDVFIAFTSVSCKFLAEVHAGDTLYPQLEITGLAPHDDTGEVTTRATIHNQHGQLVLDGEHTYLLKTGSRAHRRPRHELHPSR